MLISKLNPTYPGRGRRVGRTSGARLFFSGFGQDPLGFEYLLNYTISRLIEGQDPWIRDDLDNCPDIYMISSYDEHDHYCATTAMNGPLTGLDAGLSVDTASLEVLSDAGVEITVNGSSEGAVCTKKAAEKMRMLQRIIDAYDSIEILGWSFGVRAARSVIERLEIQDGKITFAAAMGGTVAAVDPVYGIDPRVYALTLRRLNIATFRQFLSNMCMPLKGREDDMERGRDVFELLNAVSVTQISDARMEDLKEELRALPDFPLTYAFDSRIFLESDGSESRCGLPKLIYNQALICDADGIFRSDAQLRYWQRYKEELGRAGGGRFEVLQFPIPHLYPQALLNALIASIHGKD